MPATSAGMTKRMFPALRFAPSGPRSPPRATPRAPCPTLTHGEASAISRPSSALTGGKKVPSISFNTGVAEYFNKARGDTVIVTGCNTSGCIRASAVDSFSYRYRTIVPEDCVGDIEEEPHRDNLRDIGRRYVDVCDLATVLAYLEE